MGSKSVLGYLRQIRIFMISFIANKYRQYKVIKALKILKQDASFVTESTSIAFSSKVCDIIEKSLGVDSTHYKHIRLFFYDTTITDRERVSYPTNFQVVERLKDKEQFCSIIDSVIDSINTFGLLLPITINKNFLSEYSNFQIFIGGLIYSAFLLSIGYRFPILRNLLPPYDYDHSSPIKQKGKDTLILPKTDSLKTLHSKSIEKIKQP